MGSRRSCTSGWPDGGQHAAAGAEAAAGPATARRRTARPRATAQPTRRRHYVENGTAYFRYLFGTRVEANDPLVTTSGTWRLEPTGATLRRVEVCDSRQLGATIVGSFAADATAIVMNDGEPARSQITWRKL